MFADEKNVNLVKLIGSGGCKYVMLSLLGTRSLA